MNWVCNFAFTGKILNAICRCRFRWRSDFADFWRDGHLSRKYPERRGQPLVWRIGEVFRICK